VFEKRFEKNRHHSIILAQGGAMLDLRLSVPPRRTERTSKMTTSRPTFAGLRKVVRV
jgi:hypothetical protein